MSYILMRNINKYLREYKQAIQEMFNLFPNALFQIGCSSFNSCTYEDFEANIPIEKFAPIAMDFYLSVDDLFDFSTPRIIREGYWTWKEYIKVTLIWRKQYNHYRVDYWQKGKPKIHKISKNIRLISPKEGYGLFQWEKNYKTLLRLLKNNPDKELKKRFKKQVDEANEQVLKWQKAMENAYQESMKIEKEV